MKMMTLILIVLLFACSVFASSQQAEVPRENKEVQTQEYEVTQLPLNESSGSSSKRSLGREVMTEDGLMVETRGGLNDFPLNSNYAQADILSIDIDKQDFIANERLLRLSVKKNIKTGVRIQSLKQEYKYLKQREDEYYTKRPKYSDEEAIVQDLDDVLEVKDPVLRDIYSKQEKILKELETKKNAAKDDFRQIPDVGVLSNISCGPLMMLLLKKIDEPFSLVSQSFSADIVKYHPILMIPYGGLYGIKKTHELKEHLGSYVQNGGTLIVFAQQTGNDLKILPVSQDINGATRQIRGYGWNEYEFPHVDEVYISAPHQVFSGQDKPQFQLHIGGYFTGYPSNATVLLRRSSDNQAVMLEYGYGLGKVILLGLYTDFAFMKGHTSEGEIALVKDIIIWAKKPMVLPEIKADETITLLLAVKNYSDKNAYKILFTITEPHRRVFIDKNLEKLISSGQSIDVPFSYKTDPTISSGLWRVDYTLLDKSDNIIQPQAETDAGRFVVTSKRKNLK